MNLGCQTPVTSDYYIAIIGRGDNYTLDVATSLPNCPNNCSNHGICKNSGVCVCYFVWTRLSQLIFEGWTGSSCQGSMWTPLGGNNPWTIVDTLSAGIEKTYTFAPVSSHPLFIEVFTESSSTVVVYEDQFRVRLWWSWELMLAELCHIIIWCYSTSCFESQSMWRLYKSTLVHCCKH